MAINTPNTPPKVDKIEIAIPKDNGEMDEQTLLSQDALKKWYFTAEMQKNLQEVKDEVSNDPRHDLFVLIEYLMSHPIRYKMKSDILVDKEEKPYKAITIEIADQKEHYQYMTIFIDFPQKGNYKIDLIPRQGDLPAISFLGKGNLPKSWNNSVLQFIKYANNKDLQIIK